MESELQTREQLYKNEYFSPQCIYSIVNFAFKENHFFCERYRNESKLHNKAKPLRTSSML